MRKNGGAREKTWKLKGEIDTKNTGHFETILTLANGFIGMRGSFGFSAGSGRPGFYAAGLFNKTPVFKSELVNLPNPFDYFLVINDEKQGIDSCRVLSSEYELDMKNGVLKTATVLENRGRKRTKIEEQRFLHKKEKQLAIMSVKITPLNYSGAGYILHSFNLNEAYTKVNNNRVYHLSPKSSGFLNNGSYLEAETTHTGVKISQAAVLNSSTPLKNGFSEQISGIYPAALKKNKGFNFNIYSAVYTSRDKGYSAKKAEMAAARAAKKGFLKLKKEHAGEWIKAWKEAGVEIAGDDNALLLTRYNIFSLMGLSPYKPGISIGAKGLHGEGYRGHAFWDTELYLLPFYIFTDPGAAANILTYRIERLGSARKYAKKLGYKGARFPWESADTGEDVTPEGAHTVNQEHIISDIACAIGNYISARGRDKLFPYLYEILIESARYYASRVSFDKKKGKYAMKKGIGPDEFHQDIDNNFYTNYMVIKTMEAGIEAARFFPGKVKKGETKKWKKIADNFYLPFSRKHSFHEQFDGYFRLKDIPMKTDKKGNRILSKYLMARYNSPEAPALFGKTKLLKQADAIMLYYIFYNDFPEEMIRKAYEYYEPRTTHGSSLSRCSYAIVASRLGRRKEAYRDFLRSAELDLAGKKNSAGIHAASLGGVWKIIFYGFAGISITKKGISVNPGLPAKWKKLSFHFKYRKSVIKYELTKGRIVLKKIKGPAVDVEIRGNKYTLTGALRVAA